MGFFKDDPETTARKQAEKEAKEQERREAAFRASPVGQARESYERGDVLFQASFNIQSVKTLVVAMEKAKTVATATDVSAVLNAIVREGWNFASMSTAFVQEGQESRDKFVASGQQTAVRGRLVGTYVFVRRQGSTSVPGPMNVSI